MISARKAKTGWRNGAVDGETVRAVDDGVTIKLGSIGRVIHRLQDLLVRDVT